MALGMVILEEAVNDSLREFGMKESSVLHIQPNVNQIVSQLEYILENKKYNIVRI